MQRQSGLLFYAKVIGFTLFFYVISLLLAVLWVIYLNVGYDDIFSSATERIHKVHVVGFL